MSNWLDRRIFYGVLIADVVLFPITTYLASIDIKSMAIAIPMLLLNLPALPVAIAFSVIGDDPQMNTSPIGPVGMLIAMALSIIVTASTGWAFIVSLVLRGKKSERRSNGLRDNIV